MEFDRLCDLVKVFGEGKGEARGYSILIGEGKKPLGYWPKKKYIKNI